MARRRTAKKAKKEAPPPLHQQAELPLAPAAPAPAAPPPPTSEPPQAPPSEVTVASAVVAAIASQPAAASVIARAAAIVSPKRALFPAPWHRRLLAGVVALGFALRCYGLTWGLPHLFNGDEPPFVNLAFGFFSRDFNPHVFRHPTLWMYVLFLSYGVFFVLWSALGLRKSVEQFGGLFAWKPAPFYLISRLLAAALSCAGLVVVDRLERRLARWRGEPEPDFPWAAAILAVSPALALAGRAGRPDALMFLLSAFAWIWAVELYFRGRLLDYLLTGLFAGLAFSAQFAALPVLLLAPLAHLLRWKRSAASPPGAAWLAAGLFACFLGFALGSPFALWELPGLLGGLREQAALLGSVTVDHSHLYKLIGGIALWQAGVWSFAGLAFLRGMWILGCEEPGLLALLAGPFVLFGLAMGAQPEGGSAPLYFACFPALALIAGVGARDVASRLSSAWILGPLLIWTLAPGVSESLLSGRRMLLPDTREEAQRWIEAHLPQGSGILLDQPHASPDLVMDRSRVQELIKQNQALGSTRVRDYELRLKFHPGGGYRIWRIQRSALDLWPPAATAERSQKEGPFLDVRPGLSVLRDKGIRYVVTTEYGADPSRAPEFRAFFDELLRQGRELADFRPVKGERAGPAIKVYSIGG